MAQESVQQVLDRAIKDENGPAGLVFASIDKTGKVLASAASGVRSVDKPDDKMTLDTVFPIWSCTKMIAAMACMQLVEQGKLQLDGPAEQYLPELAKVKLHNGDSPKTKITLRHLLTHTAGFGYTFFNEPIKQWHEKSGHDEFDGTKEGTLGQPLICEPGTEWHYSVSIDWAGQVLEAVTGMTLGEYCRKNIFEPLGCKDIQYGVNPSHRDRLATMHFRSADDKVSVRQGQFPMHTGKPEFDSAGAGATSTVGDYLKVVNVLINDGVGANGTRIIKSETLKTMLTDQLGDLPQKDPLDQPIPSTRKDLSNDTELMPGLKKGWGLSFLIIQDPLPTGRAGGSVWWAGLANLFWMADPVTGVANMILSQCLPFNDMKVIGTWLEAEGAVYASLR